MLLLKPPTAAEASLDTDAGRYLQIRDEWEAREEERRKMVKSLRKSGKGQPDADDAPRYVAYVPLPEQKEIELRVLAKKKHDLMAKYASDSLIQQQEEAKQLLNLHE